MAAHIQERHGEQRAILLETTDHALLALGDEHQTLRSDFRDGRDAAAGNVLLGDELETFVGLRLAGLGDDGDNVQDLYAAADGEVFAL